MSRYKSGDIVKYKFDETSEHFEVIRYYKMPKLISYELEDINGKRHDCYYPNKLKLVKRLI
jgi:hypothetical protein